MGYLYESFHAPGGMKSTAEKTANAKDWISLREDRSLDRDRYWVFTDGSTHGFYSAVVVEPGKRVMFCAEFAEQTPTRNVGAEMNGMLLALRKVPAYVDVTIVSDYLGVGAWMIGAWDAKDSEIIRKIEQGENLMTSKFRQLVEDVDDVSVHYNSVRFLHHGGHQTDDSEMTMWNCAADSLCCASPPYPLNTWLDISTVELAKVHLGAEDKAAQKKAAAFTAESGQNTLQRIKDKDPSLRSCSDEDLRALKKLCQERKKAKGSHYQVIAKPRFGEPYHIVSPQYPDRLVDWLMLGDKAPAGWEGVPPAEGVILKYIGPKSKKAKPASSAA